jgi:hypothetical protein
MKWRTGLGTARRPSTVQRRLEKLTILRKSKIAPLSAAVMKKIDWLRQRFFQISRAKVGVHFCAPFKTT